MKISSIRSHIVGDVRNFLFVVVETDEGIRGVGEGGITWREPAMAGFIEGVTPSLLGEDPLRIEHLWQVMYRSGFFPPGRIGAAGLSAIDLALWDIKAQALGVPLYELLGGLVREKVVGYPHIEAPTTGELVQAARRKVDAGWNFVRFNLPEQEDGLLEPTIAVREGIEQVAAIRAEVGPDVEIIIDVHTRLDPADAVVLCRGLEAYRPFFVEDPIRCENPESLRRLNEKVNVPIAMGEQYGSKWEFQRPIENEWIDYARIDLCIVGGLTEALKIRGWCETHSIKIAPHNPLGPVSTAACVHLDLATSNFAVQECAREPMTVLPDLFPVQVPFEAGHFLPPERPGLGVEFDEQAAKELPPVQGDCPRLRRRDGSFTNW